MNARVLWIDKSDAALIRLVQEDECIARIAVSMKKSATAIETRVNRLIRAGKLNKRPAKQPESWNIMERPDVVRSSVTEQLERQMIRDVNAMGGFPVSREITVAGQTITVWTGTKPNQLHPLWRAKAGYPQQEQVAA